MFQKVLLLLFLFTCTAAVSLAQFKRPDTWFNVGYQYANFGNSFAPATIQKYQFNRSAPEGSDLFTNAGNGYGLVVRAMIKNEKGLTSEFSLWNKKVVDKASGTDPVSGMEYDVATKTRIRCLSYGLHYSWSRFTIGGSADLGMFSSLVKYDGTGGENDGKWQPWFKTVKIFGSEPTGKTPVIGWTISAGYAITKFLDVRIYKQYTAFGMGAELSDRYFSISNWGAELSYTFGR